MQLRYMGFDQARNIRGYRFVGIARGETTKHFTVTADLALFLKYRVNIQEGPSLCLQKLGANGEGPDQFQQELTSDDLLAYVAVRTAAAERKAAARKSGTHRKAAAAG